MTCTTGNSAHPTKNDPLATCFILCIYIHGALAITQINGNFIVQLNEHISDVAGTYV